MHHAQLLGTWRKLSPLPGGRWLFSRLLGLFVPYSGSIRARIVELGPGRALIQLPDRRRVRNHLGSVHAIALCNLGELASGLAVLGGLSQDTRGIVTHVETQYTKKARGTITAECECPPLDAPVDQTVRVIATLRDGSGDEVARTTAHWKVGPRPETTSP